MKVNQNTIIGYAVLGATAALVLVLPDTLTVPKAAAQTVPDTVRILGVVRDFRMAHPDFNVTPSGGFGDSAGSVQLKLGPNKKPRTESIISSQGSNGAGTAVDTISKWGFNEANGLWAFDNRSVQDGELMNGVTRTSKGRFGKAVVFDGVDDYIHVPHDPAYIVDAASVAFWFKADETVTEQALVSKDGLGYITGGHLTSFIVNEQLRVRLQSTTGSYFVESPLGSIQPDTWYHVAFSFGPANGMMLYIDNMFIDSNPYTGGLGTSSGGAGNEQPLVLGLTNWVDGSGGGALDRFNAVAYSGSDGPVPWSGNWVEVNDDGSASSGKVRVEAGHLYVDNSDWGTSAMISRSVDLSGATSAQLTFEYGGYGTGPVDIFDVEVSDDGGANWVVLESISVIEYESDSRAYDLGSVIGLTNNVVVRFRRVQGFQADGQHFTIDNVQVAQMGNLTNPFAGMLDNLQVFTRELGTADFKVVGGYIVDHTGRDSSNRPIPPHLDEDDGAPCFAAGDTGAVVGSTNDSGVSSADTFTEWFTDVPGTNLSLPHSIDLIRNVSGVWEYLTNDFHPADGHMFGNEGAAHNESYTYSFEAKFTYTQCTGQFLEFQGGDGAWMFIDEDLALDLGGVGSSTAQYIEMDRLGLVDGQQYILRFFYAQRQSGSASFNLRTNIWLQQDPGMVVVISGAFD